MQTFQQLFSFLLNDVMIKLKDEFDRNFERKAFFTSAWKSAKRNTIGSLMIRTGSLRKSINEPVLTANSIQWSSSLPYANIHNEGGKIMVTRKMQKFFWYKYIMAAGITKNEGGKTNWNKLNNISTNKAGAWRISQRNREVGAEAMFWRAMALKPVGSFITIEKRQFIGDHPMVHQYIRETADEWVHNDFKQYIDNQLNIFDQ